MRAAAATLAAAATVVLPACGGGSSQVSQSASREWTANAAGVIDQLRADTVVASDGDSLASARAALGDESRLYGLLVAYSDFGGCRHMVGAVGGAPAGLRPVAVTLGRACTRLQLASTLFTRAASRSDARALVAAARAVDGAVSLLVRADLELQSRQQHR
jgi:hypothetical protein